MPNDLINWWEVFANAAVSFLVAVIVAVIVRYKLKTKHEELFEHNRNANLAIVFGLLNQLDFQFEQFVLVFESRLGEFTKDRKQILPKTTWKSDNSGGYNADFSSWIKVKKIYDEVKNDLAPTVENLYDIEKKLRDDYNIFHNYIHADFLRDVSLYIFNTCYFAEWSLKDAPIPDCLIRRMEIAKNIIKYLEKDRMIDKTAYSIDSFIKRWTEEFRKFEN